MVNGRFVNLDSAHNMQPTSGQIDLMYVTHVYEPLHGSELSDTNSPKYLIGGWFGSKIVKSVSKAAKKIGEGVVNVAKKIGEGVVSIAKKTGRIARKAAQSTWKARDATFRLAQHGPWRGVPAQLLKNVKGTIKAGNKTIKVLKTGVDGMVDIVDNASGKVLKVIPGPLMDDYMKLLAPIKRVTGVLDMGNALIKDMEDLGKGRLPKRTYRFVKDNAKETQRIIDTATNTILAVVPSDVADEYLKMLSPAKKISGAIEMGLSVDKDIESLIHGKVPTSALETLAKQSKYGGRALDAIAMAQAVHNDYKDMRNEPGGGNQFLKRKAQEEIYNQANKYAKRRIDEKIGLRNRRGERMNGRGLYGGMYGGLMNIPDDY